MKKSKIVIASVLKPVDDTRMFEKMGVSLSQLDHYDVFIIGQATKNIPVHAGIQFIPLSPVKRISFGRLLRPLQIGLKIFKVKPDLLIVNTHELLIVSLLNRILFGCRIVYDIRENHYRNIRFSEAFPRRWKLTLARFVRWKERFAATLFHHFILAEKCYEWQLPFIAKRFSVLENKAIAPTSIINRQNIDSGKLLFSGTIAESTGIFEAISIAESLNNENKKFTLTVIGHCALYETRIKILEIIRDKPYIKLIGFNQLVPHSKIILEIQRSDFGIIIYPPAEHISGSVPTKLFEYLANQLPIITRQDQSFAPMIVDNNAGLLVDDFPDGLADKLINSQFYPKPIPDILWEGNRFVDLVRQLIQKAKVPAPRE